MHVGTPKSGTTYLQDLMWESRAALLEAGALFPSDYPEGYDLGPTRPAGHFRAVVDFKDAGYLARPDPLVPGAWARVVEAARAHQGTTVISQELFGDRSARDAERALADLDFAEVHVVVTARDLARQLPASWQEDVKNRHYLTFADWLEGIRPGAGRHEPYARSFWSRQDVPEILRRWGAHLPAERVHVVTVPRRGADPATLWSRFAGVLDVDPQAVDLPKGLRNKSMGQVEAEFIRRLNERADYSIEYPLYNSRITGYVAEDVLPQRPGAVPLSLPAEEHWWVCAHADAMIAELAEAGYDVVGDLDELRVEARGRIEPAPPPTDIQLLDAALDAMVAVLKLEPEAPPPVVQQLKNAVRRLTAQVEAMEQTAFERERLVAWYAAELQNHR